MKTPISHQGEVDVQIETNGLATITFSHPSHNSFPSELLKTLAAHIFGMGKNDKVKVILLQSSGNRTFCAGASFDELIAIESEAAGKIFFSGFAYVINAIRLCGKIVVGRVQGKAIGGGVGLAAACDYCFASEQASIRLSELGIAIGPFVIAPAVQRKIGLVNFTALSLNPDQWRSANWAKEKGLFQEVFPSVQEMDAAVNEFCDRLASYSPEALKGLKTIFWEGTESWDELLFNRAAISGKLVMTPEARERLLAFKNK